MSYIKNSIDDKFFRAYIPDKIVKATDFDSLEKYDISFLDKDYLSFLYDILFSANISGKLGYFYVVLEIGHEMADFLRESIVNDAEQKIIKWHQDRFSISDEKPFIHTLVFNCDSV